MADETSYVGSSDHLNELGRRRGYLSETPAEGEADRSKEGKPPSRAERADLLAEIGLEQEDSQSLLARKQQKLLASKT